MKAHAALPLADELAQRNREHEPTWSMLVTESEAQELAAGRVPDQVRLMATWLCEPVEVMLQRKRRKA